MGLMISKKYKESKLVGLKCRRFMIEVFGCQKNVF